MPAAAGEVLRGLLRGRVERPLVIPLASTVAGELQGLAPAAFLADPGKISLLVRQLATAIGADAAVAEFGTGWDAEGDLSAPRPAAVIEAVRRLKTLLDGPLLAASLTCAVDRLPMARALCEAGAQIVFISESAEPPADTSAYERALGPLLGSIRFYNALAVLHLPGAADGWAPIVSRDGAYLPCFDPDAAPGLATLLERDTRRLFGIAVPPGEPGPAARHLAALGRCALITHDAELSGRVASRDLAAAATTLSELAMS
jgi:hypothetical protein